MENQDHPPTIHRLENQPQYLVNSNSDIQQPQHRPQDVPELIKYDIYDRENIFWYNPYNDIPTKDIWPDRDVEDHSKERTLWIEIPENKVGGNFGTDNNKWWNGITTSLYASDQNQSNNKYIEQRPS